MRSMCHRELRSITATAGSCRSAWVTVTLSPLLTLQVHLWENHAQKSHCEFHLEGLVLHLGSPGTEHLLKQGRTWHSGRKAKLRRWGNHQKLRSKMPQWLLFPYFKIFLKVSKYSDKFKQCTQEITSNNYHAQFSETTTERCVHAKSLSCVWLCNPMDYSLPDTGVGCHFLLQGIFLTQGSNLCLLHWQADSLPLCHANF